MKREKNKYAYRFRCFNCGSVFDVPVYMNGQDTCPFCQCPTPLFQEYVDEKGNYPPSNKNNRR